MGACFERADAEDPFSVLDAELGRAEREVEAGVWGGGAKGWDWHAQVEPDMACGDGGEGRWEDEEKVHHGASVETEGGGVHELTQGCVRMETQVDRLISLAGGGQRDSAIVASEKYGLIQEGPLIEEDGEDFWTTTEDGKTIKDVFTADLKRQAR